ncbi:helix-turn-helix domain-containing protein [Serratia sp. D1N4]
MNQKKIVLQCACHFTRIGLGTLINNTFFTESVNFIDRTNTQENFESDVSNLTYGDIVIIVLSDNDYDPVSLINLVCERLSKVPLNGRILFIGNIAYINKFRYYLASLKSAWAFIDISMPLKQLQQQLQNAALMYTDMYQCSQPTATTLTQRELTVLHRMLNEQSVIQIAKELGISEKTVSCHKRSALVKLNVRSLNPLLMGNDNKEKTDHRLSPSLNTEPPQRGRTVLHTIFDVLLKKPLAHRIATDKNENIHDQVKI